MEVLRTLQDQGLEFINLNSKLTTCLMQIRNLICQIRAYGVSEKCLFSENDLLLMSNTPRVAKCLREIAVIVSIVTISFRNISLWTGTTRNTHPRNSSCGSHSHVISVWNILMIKMFNICHFILSFSTFHSYRNVLRNFALWFWTLQNFHSFHSWD